MNISITMKQLYHHHLKFLSTIIMQPIIQPFTLIFVHDPRQQGYGVENCLPSQCKHWILSEYT